MLSTCIKLQSAQMNDMTAWSCTGWTCGRQRRPRLACRPSWPQKRHRHCPAICPSSHAPAAHLWRWPMHALDVWLRQSWTPHLRTHGEAHKLWCCTPLAPADACPGCVAEASLHATLGHRWSMTLSFTGADVAHVRRIIHTSSAGVIFQNGAAVGSCAVLQRLAALVYRTSALPGLCID